jgi:hypothetical protein
LAATGIVGCGLPPAAIVHVGEARMISVIIPVLNESQTVAKATSWTSWSSSATMLRRRSPFRRSGRGSRRTSRSNEKLRSTIYFVGDSLSMLSIGRKRSQRPQRFSPHGRNRPNQATRFAIFAILCGNGKIAAEAE